MMVVGKNLFLLLCLFSFNQVAFADPIRLDSRYRNLEHPIVSKIFSVGRSDAAALMRRLGPAHDQGDRGNCSIFSATALLESLLTLQTPVNAQYDLSEQWLAYLVNRTSTEDGSDSLNNFRAIAKYGMPREESLPYESDAWTKRDQSPLSRVRCAQARGDELKSCLVTHIDPDLLKKDARALLDPKGSYYYPEFVLAREEADELHTRLYPRTAGSTVKSSDEIKRLLRNNIPLTLDFDFYDGAWNHPAAAKLGMNVNKDHWRRGIVGFPEIGSVDRASQTKDREGHSVLIVGYDDTVTITTVQLMADGTRKRFVYQGVYYFKNSWGEKAFGSQFELGGEKFPGHGMMPQKYAHELGALYSLQLQ